MAVVAHEGQLLACTAADLEFETPRNHREVLKSPQKREWLDAEQTELATLQRHHVWRLIPKSRMPRKANLVKSTWAYKVKRGKTRKVVQFKARLCAQGFILSTIARRGIEL